MKWELLKIKIIITFQNLNLHYLQDPLHLLHLLLLNHNGADVSIYYNDETVQLNYLCSIEFIQQFIKLAVPMPVDEQQLHSCDEQLVMKQPYCFKYFIKHSVLLKLMLEPVLKLHSSDLLFDL